jgi:hypothetical protein
MASPIRKEELETEYFFNLKDNAEIIIESDKSIFKILRSSEGFKINFDKNNPDLVKIADRAGLFELEMEYMSSSDSYNAKTINCKKSSDKDFTTWLKELSGRGGIGYVVPDTNMVYRSYYSSYFRNKLPMRRSFEWYKIFLIPRLLVLEIENIYNRSSKDSGKKDYEEKRKEKRIAFNSMAEIHKMISDGATFSHKIDYSLLREFTKVAGQGFADAFIRMEISRYHIGDVNSNPTRINPVIFLTCDLMNAMAGTAEGLNCIYIHRSNTIREDYNDLASLIYHSSIQFDECYFTVNRDQTIKKYRAQSMWSGKGVDDWKNDLVIVEQS